jgi:phage tail-like protein
VTPPDDARGRFAGHPYLLEIDGTVRAAFRECSGLGADTDRVDLHEGTGGGRVRMVAPPPTRITLRSGVADVRGGLWDWLRSFEDGLPRTDVAIVLLDERGLARLRWALQHARPRKWEGPTLTAKGGGDVAIESLELEHEGLTITEPEQGAERRPHDDP